LLIYGASSRLRVSIKEPTKFRSLSSSESCTSYACPRVSPELRKVCLRAFGSTIRRADQILVIEGGYIVERGTHESLFALCDATSTSTSASTDWKPTTSSPQAKAMWWKRQSRVLKLPALESLCRGL